MNYLEKKQQLVKEFNDITARQKEIVGALKIIEELEKEPPKEDKKNEPTKK